MTLQIDRQNCNTAVFREKTENLKPVTNLIVVATSKNEDMLQETKIVAMQKGSYLARIAKQFINQYK